MNEDADQRTLLRKYERELRKLRAELTRRNKELVDKRHLLEVGSTGYTAKVGMSMPTRRQWVATRYHRLRG